MTDQPPPTRIFRGCRSAEDALQNFLAWYDAQAEQELRKGAGYLFFECAWDSEAVSTWLVEMQGLVAVNREAARLLVATALADRDATDDAI